MTQAQQKQTQGGSAGLLDLYTRMVLIRRAEERLAKVVAEVGLPGGVHLSIGQEAVAAGVCCQLDERDWITSTHRGHGHFLAKGGDLSQMFAEIWGKRTGICKGMGGSMHVADFTKGILGANGIVGGGLAIATGAALAAKLDEKGRAAVCFFGDGAANQGVFMESMNVSAAWKLPTVFVCENNGLSEFTVSSTVTAGALADRARAFNIPCDVLDGNDVLAVAAAAERAILRCRRDEGPSYIEAKTYRIRGHLEAEDSFLGGGCYRTAEEIERWQTPAADPIARFRTYLTSTGHCLPGELDEIDASVTQDIDTAIAFADSSEPADPGLVYELMSVRAPS
jgi:TPP-dependent pyruvate/acetoin dehydrogenase alpha subunit